MITIVSLILIALLGLCLLRGINPRNRRHDGIAANAAALDADKLRAMTVELMDLPADADDGTIQDTFNSFGEEPADNEAKQEEAVSRFKEGCVALGIPETSTPEEFHAAVLAVPTKLKATNESTSKALLDTAINEGRITAAQRPTYELAFNSDPTKAAALLSKETKKLNTTPVDLSGRKDIVANVDDAAEKIQTAVNERMEKGEDYETAWIAVKKDPKLKKYHEVLSMKPEVATA